MRERIAIIDGVRTPMAKAGGILQEISADTLGTHATRELLNRTGFDPAEIDEVIFGNVAQPADAANVSRVIALRAGIPINIPAYTVHRNCASGMEAITSGALKILNGSAQVILAGGTESMSNIPLMFNRQYVKWAAGMARAKTTGQKLGQLLKFRPKMLKPVIGVMQGLTDPVSGMMMGDTAEVLAREFAVTREEQDEYALLSHERAIAAADQGLFEREIMPIPLPPKNDTLVESDQGPRRGQSMEALAKLKPYFDRQAGTVTVGNACPITDGAAALLLMSESGARKRGFEPLGYLKEFAYASLEPERMGLGPAYATAKLFEKTGGSMSDFDAVELNEAFAAQVIANERAFPSQQFAETYLNRSKPLGELKREILNAQGGAIALGHPVGMTGTRLVLHLLLELRRINRNSGLATLCVGGGQGAALHLEVA